MLGRIFGAGLGWTFGGPIGGLIGWWLGGQYEEDSRPDFPGIPPQNTETRPGDFAIAILVLLAAVMKADGRVVKAELEYVKSSLLANFGKQSAQEMLLLLKNLLEQDYYIYEIAGQVNRHMSQAEKLQLIHTLFGISQADGKVHKREVEVIREIAEHLKLNAADVDAIQAIFVKSARKAYTILELDPDCTDQEVKKAYRSMAARFHPDKVQHLGPEFQKMAEDKFKAINGAYQEIKLERGL